MEQLPSFLEKKQRIFEAYRRSFEGLEEARIFVPPPESQSNHWLNSLILAPGSERELHTILEHAHQNRILLRPAWKPLHSLEMYRDAPRMNLEGTEKIARSLISLPSSAGLLDA